MSTLEEIQAIKRLKYRYLRCLDCKDWAGLADTLAPDATSSYDGGRYSFSGPDKIVGFIEGALGRPAVLTRHHCHHPEIDLTSDTTATGVWYLEDTVIDTEHNTQLQGCAFYRDEYVKLDGAWKIRSTGYERTYEEVFDRGETPSRRLTRTRFDGS